jgi:hypothetical protein
MNRLYANFKTVAEIMYIRAIDDSAAAGMLNADNRSASL